MVFVVLLTFGIHWPSDAQKWPSKCVNLQNLSWFQSYSSYLNLLLFPWLPGLDSVRLTTSFRKYISACLPMKTNNPNPSPTEKNWSGLYWSGASDRVIFFSRQLNPYLAMYPSIFSDMGHLLSLLQNRRSASASASRADSSISFLYSPCPLLTFVSKCPECRSSPVFRDWNSRAVETEKISTAKRKHFAGSCLWKQRVRFMESWAFSHFPTRYYDTVKWDGGICEQDINGKILSGFSWQYLFANYVMCVYYNFFGWNSSIIFW